MRIRLIQRVNKVTFYSILADGTTDSERIEQLVLVVRFVENDSSIQEHFLGFEELEVGTGVGIGNKIINTLEAYGLNLDNMRGQAYDGCAAMKSNKKGAQAVILEHSPKALYAHCGSHTLNLVIAHCCDVLEISNCFATLKEASHFVRGSAKRMAVLKLKIAELPSKKKVLTGLCATRWVERHETVVHFVDMYPAVVEALTVYLDWEDRTASFEADQFLASIRSHTFLVALHTLARFSGLLLPVSAALQKTNTDMIECIGMIDTVKNVIQKDRNDSEEAFHSIYVMAEMAAGEPLTSPRLSRKQTQGANYQTTDLEAYYRQSIYVRFVDNLLAELAERFSKHSNMACTMQNLVPRYVSEGSFSKLIGAIDLYEDDLPGTRKDLKNKFDTWLMKWQTFDQERPQNVIDALPHAKRLFPNILCLLKIFDTIPVTKAFSERCFSCLRRLKTYLRSTMGQDLLSGLAMINLYRKHCPPTEEIIDELANKPRRLDIVL